MNASSANLANALALYIQAKVDSNTSSNTNNTIPISQIDRILGSLNNINIATGSGSSFLMAQILNHNDSNGIVVGATFLANSGGSIITNQTRSLPINSNVSVAATINDASLIGVTSLNMFIIDKPTEYEIINNSTDNKTLASAVVVAAVRRNGNASNTMNISLFFQVLDQYRPNVSATYRCSFYDNSTSSPAWNDAGCTAPQYNTQFARYECNCNHLTSFALIWLPQSLLGSYGRDLRPADIASLVFQSLSIVCFLAIIIHALAIRIINPIMRLQASDLLPLISCASTTLLFIFYITLGMTVYTQTSSQNQTQCFLSSSVLMFFVYFLLIFMFCAKTSVGYFNYLRFVYLFPQPSYRRLVILLIISFFVSIGLTAFAAGFNSNSSFSITQLYPYKLCWFTHTVIYYFLTIPVCLFLLLNLITIIFVGKHIIVHARNATSPHQSYERMKRCVLVLLSSCVTQGIGWLFGPFISFVNPTAGEVLEWFFIVFNGLEGLWSVLLYIIIRSQRIDEQKRVTAATEIKKTLSTTMSKNREPSGRNDRRRSSVGTGDIEVIQRNVRREPERIFDDIGENRTINWHTNEEDSSSL